MDEWMNEWMNGFHLFSLWRLSCSAVIYAWIIFGTIRGFALWLGGHSAGQVTPRPFLAMVDRKKCISIVTYSRLLNTYKFISPNFLKGKIYLNIRNNLEKVIMQRHFFLPTSAKKGRVSWVSHSIQKAIGWIMDIHLIGKLESYPSTTFQRDKRSKVLKQIEYWTFTC